MNRISAKLLGIFAIFLFIAIVPIAVFATNEDISIVSTINEDAKQEYTIYIKEMSTQNFKYAFTNIENADPNGIDLSYINSVPDLGGNQAAFLDAVTYEKLSENNNTIYMWAKITDQEGNEELVLENVQLDLTQALTDESLEQVETLTERIEVEIAETQDITDSTEPVRNENVDGVVEISKTGYVKITDSEDATYYYQRIELPSTSDYNRFMELAEEIESTYNSMNMYEKVQIATEFNSLYAKLVEVDNWQEVENMEVKQPESSIESNGEGNKYIVFLKKVADDGETTTDAQFLQEYYAYEQNIEIEKVVTQETTKLPITYDNIALFVVLGIIVVLVVLVFIRMKKLNKQNEEK